MFPNRLTTNFSHAACRQLARAARAAYQPEPVLASDAQSCGATTFKFIESTSTDTQCYVTANSNDVVIAFRGTEPSQVKDWLTDAEFTKRSWYGTRVHHGFADAIDSVWPEIFAELRRIQNQGSSIRNLWITGHSLGGALAQLCATRLRDCGQFIAGVYTFGQPRVGDTDFALSYEIGLQSKTFRVVNENDIVPRVPFIGFRHAGTEIFLNNFGGVNVAPAWYIKLSSDAAGLWYNCHRRGLLHAIDTLIIDHAMDRYLERIWN